MSGCRFKAAARRHPTPWRYPTMLDATRSYLRQYDYRHPNHRRACKQARARSRGRCQGCGYRFADHGHHWALRYLPPAATTANDLTGLCWLCHRVITLLRRFLSVGGDPVRFLKIFVAALAETDDIGPRTGRCRRIGRACGACVSGRTRPCVWRSHQGDPALRRVGLHDCDRHRRWRAGTLAGAHGLAEGPREVLERLVVRHVTIFGHGHGLQRAIIDESQHRKPERLLMAQH